MNNPIKTPTPKKEIRQMEQTEPGRSRLLLLLAGAFFGLSAVLAV